MKIKLGIEHGNAGWLANNMTIGLQGIFGYWNYWLYIRQMHMYKKTNNFFFSFFLKINLFYYYILNIFLQIETTKNLLSIKT